MNKAFKTKIITRNNQPTITKTKGSLDKCQGCIGTFKYCYCLTSKK